MSTLLNNFSGVTVVLFKAQFASELPLKKDLRNLLNVKDINFYKRNGIHESDVSMLELALGIVREPVLYKLFPSYPKYACTDIIITKPDVKGNIFANLKYDSKLIEGFNLSGSCLIELKLLLKKYIMTIEVKLCALEWLSCAESNLKVFNTHNVVDDSVTGYDLQALQNFVDNYGTKGLTSARADIADWLTQYCWN
jgi:hypothetical protein